MALVTGGIKGIETILRTRVVAKAVPFLLQRFGVTIQVYRQTDTGDAQTNTVASPPVATSMDAVYNTVYGPYANLTPQIDYLTGLAQVHSFSAVILLPQFAFSASDPTFAGDFDEHFIVAAVGTDLRPEDRFFITRTDGVTKGWKIIERESVGMSQTVLVRWKNLSGTRRNGECLMFSILRTAKDDWAYHGTFERFIKSIPEKGLWATRLYSGDPDAGIYLTSSQAVAKSYGKVLLRVKESDIANKEVLPSAPGDPKIFRTLTAIKPDKIQVLKDGKWVKL